MTAKEQAFLRDLRRVMRDHKVELRSPDYESPVFDGPEINLCIDGWIFDELEDKGGNRDEV